MDTTAHLSEVDIYFLKAGAVEVGLAPALGGAVSHAKINNVDFMRPWTGERTPRKTSSYPLVPYSNRIADACFEYQDNKFQLELNFGDHPHSLHGVGWQRCWQFERVSESKAQMKLVHTPEQEGGENWPFAFEVVQEFEAHADGLSVKMIFTNKEDHTVPVGLGWHPFFPRHDGVTLQYQAQAVILNDENMLPQPAESIPEGWDFSESKSLSYPGLDNCFVGWNGSASLTWPHQKMKLIMSASENLRHLVVMTPPMPNNFFAVEPVSHANNAINMDDPAQHGIQMVAAGQSVECWMRLKVENI